MNNTKETLRLLCAAGGVTGNEFAASNTAAELLRRYIPDAAVDAFGNVTGLLRSKNPDAKTVLLDAHIDQVGLIVTAIDDRGFLKVHHCGGIDRRTLPAQTVTVHGKRDIPGVVGTIAAHLEKPEEKDKIPKITDMFLDIGMTKEEAEKVVSLGDFVTVNSDFTEMLNGRITAKALDDRAGVAAILYALELLRGTELDVNLAVQFSSREETGCQGAMIATYRFDPDISLAIDVDFATTPDMDDPRKANKMGEGVIITHAAAIDRELSRRLVALAKDAEIPYQEHVEAGSTGTNSDLIYTVRDGVRACLIGIPLRYMHTAIEMIQISDVEETGRLAAEFVKKAGNIHVL
jgi:putative aminopeptidase FrvX